MSKYTEDDLKKELKTKQYEYGFYTDIEADTLPVGLNEDIIIAISKKKEATKDFWDLMVETANNMNWEVKELNQRCAQGSLLRNNKCKTVKDLLITYCNIDMSYPIIGDPEGVTA